MTTQDWGIKTWQHPGPSELLGDKNVISCLEVSWPELSPRDGDINYLSLSLQVLFVAALALVDCSPVAPPAYPVEAYPDIAPNYNVSQNIIFSLSLSHKNPPGNYLGAMPSSIMFEYISTTNRWMYQNIWQGYKTQGSRE